jgi:hypothetical protein
LRAGDLPPGAVEIAEEKKSFFRACFDFFETAYFPSLAIGLKQPVALMNGVG